MRQTIDLLDLMAARPIMHPSRITSFELIGDVVTLSLEGAAWWREDRPESEGEIRFRFHGVACGSIDLTELVDPEWDEALDVFHIERTSNLPWVQPSTVSIFCNGAIPMPLAVYTRVQNYLLDVSALRSPSDFLNGGDRLSWFLEIARSPVHQLATAPPAIADLIINELNDQGVPHSVTFPRGGAVPALLIRIGDHGFFCTQATAEFDLD
ncbi:hypothetical protein QOZ96_001175 [Brevundimonas nasdae]|uniref:hypothetical protein n=1 Tax=Brevundimonas nasdae TaxID=172043 RepID=UPI001914A221|nr:hypothetical protein [Brevundimonas nasdae]MBK6024804.1 hypothetical protein [Brevundimonas nasdae]MDQ0451232.1 hypothetical protein [Brevundimonas nasdae]